ncbi:hypothetical protein J7T55_008687 [Diaporthe amygdali]|uniref:uncharacterized protein n=1 Tax=Phomopsis amygdali TaxID=1214568 RepID=UPI0022FEA4A3|nr:uncharacterized protein J7T55_008687 [Diaporthe amygdali]KAJ0121523.1 hypothetical protein J7T55_008687 [Diaporthe amygdali]
MGNTLSILTNKTFVGYATLFVVVGLVGYTQHNAKQVKQQKLASQKQRVQDSREQPKKENKAKRQRMESFASESSKQPQPKAQPKSYAAATQSKAKDYSSDDGVDNREFAKQMAQNKKSKFAPKVNNEQKQKSVKQSKAKDISHETPADNGKASAPSAPSSTAGIDGDDDQSSAASPIVAAADPTGISDMLEQPASGPSVLRLTDTAEKQQKPRQAKAPQPTETKKQRQNRLKVERAKAQREEDEKARKVLMEAQRRTAREAEGRAAKDGSSWTTVPKSSAWTGNGVNGKSEQTPAAASVQPLDTFDNTPKAAAVTAPAPAQKKDTAKQNGAKTSWADIPYSEEEQLEMLKKESEEWVPVSKSRKKKSKNTSAVSETDESAAENHAAPASNKPGFKANEINGRPKAKALPSQSSFAALTDDGANLAEEQEQEWDV